MGGVEVPQAPKGVGAWGGVSPPHWGKGLVLFPPQKFFCIFLLKTLYFDAF